MKKVRYAIGAAGMAPALGLMMPAMNATAAGAHAAPKNGAKTVSLDHGKTPLVSCGARHSKGATKGPLHGIINYSGVCVHSQAAWLDKAQSGLTERIRFYSGGGRLER